MSEAAQVVSIALAEVGYKEKATNADLDLATANAGTGNWTKYARDLYNAGYYNGNKNGYAWCDVFVDWCFFKAFGKTEGQLMECQTGDLGAAVPYSAGYYKAQGRYDTTPKVGDQVFFQENGELVHTGIVVEVSASQIVTVEGNSSNQVKKNTYSRTSSYIAGYGHPKYDGDDSGSGSSGDAAAVTPAVEQSLTVTLNLLESGHTGPQVTAVQRLLRAGGITGADGKELDVDGEFGPNTKAAVITVQKKLFPGTSSEWDGEVGQKTWSGMLTSTW